MIGSWGIINPFLTHWGLADSVGVLYLSIKGDLPLDFIDVLLSTMEEVTLGDDRRPLPIKGVSFFTRCKALCLKSPGEKYIDLRPHEPVDYILSPSVLKYMYNRTPLLWTPIYCVPIFKG